MYKIMIVGEAWGETEAALRMPFVGPAGYELNGQLKDAGIDRRECYVTNVFNLHPAGNDIKSLCCTKKDSTNALPLIISGHYLRTEFTPELTRLYAEVSEIKPNIILALGGTALWAFTGLNGINKYRGTVQFSTNGPPTKLLATFHPAAVIRQYNLRAIAIADLMKAKRHSAVPEITIPTRKIWIEPAIADIQVFLDEHCRCARYIAVDIETANDQLTCIGFAVSPNLSLVIPFWDPRKNGNYWPTFEYEREVWSLVRTILHLPVPKIFQNGLYDLAWLWKKYGLTVKNCQHDTMLLSHALYPEMLKGLGFLGSIYCDLPAWKAVHREQTLKKEG